MQKNVLFAQSGGPTSVINASCYGIIKEAKKINSQIYAAKYGVEGIMKEQLINMTDVDDTTLETLRFSPSSAFGSCRYKLKEEDFDSVFSVFDKYNIGYFFYIGGNDSMDTANKLSKYAKKIGYEIKIIGIPKTIDNDLVNTHCCPGFGSAAKYIATSVREIALDAEVYGKKAATVVEVMGRDSGFLAAASALAADEVVDSPHLIYLPETPFDENHFLRDVENHMAKKDQIFIVTAEGIKDKNGNFAYLRNKDAKDSFNHIALGGVGKYLEYLITSNKLASKIRTIELSLLQRCAAHLASKVDNDIATMVGTSGVKYSLEGLTDIMVSVVKTENDFQAGATPLAEVAGQVKLVPSEWIDVENRWVTKEAIDYILPLIEGEVRPKYEKGLPKYVRFI